jgi:ferredoxin
MTEAAPHPNFVRLAERLNRFPQGAPPTPSLFKILQVLFSEKEAGLVAQMPIKPFTAEQASRIWNMDLRGACKMLDNLAGRALLLDTEWDGKQTYVLPPPMAGFFEFSMMRLRQDIDQNLLGELYYQYCTVEDDFMKNLFSGGETQPGRVFINEPVVREAHVLDYERASNVIRTATYRAVSLCYCRHKAKIVERACKAPLEICMTFNGAAQSLIKHGYARCVDPSEGLDLLQLAYEHNLVQFGENSRQGVSFICNCCGCCCEALIAARRFGVLNPIHTTNFMPAVEPNLCNGCGKCVAVCPVEGMTLVSANDPYQPNRKLAKLDEETCLGCGVCVRVCPQKGIAMQPRLERVITPLNNTHRILMMALERGKLQDLVFDNRALWSQRTLAALLGAFLKLPPVKRAAASRQMKSRYLEALAARYG